MSDFIGPGLYQFASAKNPKAFVDLNAGLGTNGTKVQTWGNNVNTHWHIVAAGIGHSGKEEYTFYNKVSGTPLCYDGDKEGGIINTWNYSPSHKTIRWSIIPLRNGTGMYWIAPVTNKMLSLNCKDGKTSNGNPLQLWGGSSKPKDIASQWYIRLVDGFPTNFPDVPKADATADSKL